MSPFLRPVSLVVARPGFENAILAGLFQMGASSVRMPPAGMAGDGLELVTAGAVSLGFVRVHRCASIAVLAIL
jgi:hypothetical protein